MPKIVYHLVDPYAKELFYLIAGEGARRGIQLEIVTESPVIEKYMKQRGIGVVNLSDRLKEAMTSVRKLDAQAKVDFINNEFGVSVEDVTYSDSVLRKKPLDYRATISMAYLLAWKEYFEESCPQLVTAADGSETPNITFCTAARKCGVHIMYLSGGSVFPGNIYWDSTIMLGDWVKREYLEQEPSDSERKKVLQYMSASNKERPVLGHARPSIFSTKRLSKAARYFWDCVIRGKSRYHPFSIKATYELFVNQARAKGLYSQPDFRDKIVFFPLHVPNDAQITLRAPHFVEQYKAVEMCARSIPEAYTLYVKEHPHSKGAIPLSWLKRMVSLPNVKLVPPDINAHDLIEKSHCIITINSDVGWEALLHGKPVVVLAKPFYSGLGLTFDVGCFEYSGVSHVSFDEESEKRLYIRVREALDQLKLEEEAVLRLINAAMKSVYPGSFYNNQGEFNCDHSNVENIVDSILAEYRKQVN